jgi:hypothetical protein
MNLPHYMETSVRESHFVLLICTPTFAEKANAGKGGVGYEKTIVTGEIYTGASEDTKFVPVLRSGTPDGALPSYLRSRLFVDMRRDAQFDAGVEELLRHIHGVPRAKRPALGSKPQFALVSNPADKIAESPGQVHGAPGGKFDIGMFTKLRDFAYGSKGLDLSAADAKKWAMQQVSDHPPFNVQRYFELYDFAYGSKGLDLSAAEAKKLALEHVSDARPSMFKDTSSCAISPMGATAWTSARRMQGSGR